LQRWPEGLGARGHARRPSELAPIGRGCCLGRLALTRRRTPTSRSAVPLHTTMENPTCVDVWSRGDGAPSRGDVRREPFSDRVVDLSVDSLTAALGRITLGFMKWLVVLCLCVVGCADDGPPRIPGNGTPIPPGTGSGGNGGAGGVGGVGGAGGVGGGALGACDNDRDLEASEDVGDNVRDIARICGLPNNPSSWCGLIFNLQDYEECINQCVEREVPGLSSECAACYGALERCGVAHMPSCRTPCQQNSCGDSCLTCLEGAGCIENFEDCRGLPGDGCPEPSP
jgi:hypothetical protein